MSGRRSVSSRATALLVSGALAACGASTALVPRGPHPPHVQEFVEVAYPPPPAQVEEIPDGLADASCLWEGGHYSWEGRRWEWQPGHWVRPAPDCYYAPPVIAWSHAAGEHLYFTPPRWYRNDAAELSKERAGCPEPPTCKS